MITFTVNGERRELDEASLHALVMVLRDQLKLTGTKFGCGMGLVGACTVHLDGVAVRSCQLRWPPSRATASPPSKACRRRKTIRCTGLGRRRCAAMRLLSIGADHVGGGVAQHWRGSH